MCLGIPGEVIDVRDLHGVRYGTVQFAGVTRDVCLECQPDVAPGDFVLVHVGFAIAKIDREEAARAWRVLEEIGELNDLFANGEERGGVS
ncbi:MAG: HypC/HybG/HupF family hydrogenase formation chaperone [Labilithrix sp.]|nr:HypC/HybG/HupF family hydrogenase formation chaperone [Labilithrix sp.]MCW5815659.1 HypC/HybG/HupF family hydrogenase formation chaperone [Labilithrix sp.]